MEKPFDSLLSKLTHNQLMILKYLLGRPQAIVVSGELARKCGIVEKQLGGVLSAMSRKRVEGVALITPMGRDQVGGLRWRLNPKALTIALAIPQVKALSASY